MSNLEEHSKMLQATELKMIEVQETISKKIADHQTELHTLQEQAKNYRDAIKQAMEEKGIKKFENQYVSLTYSEPSSRTIFDSTRFKKEQPEVYEQYTKTSEVSASLRIKVKEPSDQLSLVEKADDEDDSI